MAWQIRYWLGASSRPLVDSDQIGDVEFARYPVPTWPEWATATNVSTGEIRYGHHGEWRSYLPVEVTERNRAQERARVAAAIDRQLGTMPTTTVIYVDDRGMVDLRIAGERQIKRIHISALDSASRQPDRALALYYSRVLAAAHTWRPMGSDVRVLMGPAA